MKKFFLIVAILAIVCPAQATILLDENFTGATIYNNLTISANSNLGKWVDLDKWSINSTGPNSFAQQGPLTSDNTNLLAYGMSLSGISGTRYILDFDYIATNRAPEGVWLAGMNIGGNVLDPFAPWFYPADSNDPSAFLKGTLSSQSDWYHVHYEGDLPQGYDALVFGFAAGGASGIRGLDNVKIQAVPEPATWLLLGLGMLGVARYGKKKLN